MTDKITGVGCSTSSTASYEEMIKAYNQNQDNLKQPPFDKPWEGAEYLFPRIIQRCKDGHREHGETWRDGRYEALAKLAATSSARLVLLDIVRKADAYAETNDLTQLIDVIVYALLEAVRHINNEAEKC